MSWRPPRPGLRFAALLGVLLAVMALIVGTMTGGSRPPGQPTGSIVPNPYD